MYMRVRGRGVKEDRKNVCAVNVWPLGVIVLHCGTFTLNVYSVLQSMVSEIVALPSINSMTSWLCGKSAFSIKKQSSTNYFSCPWQCLETSVPSTVHLAVSLNLCSSRSKAPGESSPF